jgi:HEAT repeat protein
VTPEGRDLIFSFVTAPGSSPAISETDLLRHFDATDGRSLGLSLLRAAIRDRNAVDVEAALIVCSIFGVGSEHLPLLIELVSADWHQQHENVVSLLDRLTAPDAVDALLHAATWVPDYLDYDENRALATKAIWALGKIGTSESRAALQELRYSDDEVVREEAASQIARVDRGNA